jgi:hypothetical protein
MPLRLRSLFRRNDVERDLDDEFRDHIERRIAEGVAQGTTPAEARYEALRAMGGVEQRKEECRDMRSVTAIEHRIQDFRFAVRQLLRYRGFTVAAILVMALGIAASVSMFGFVDAALIRPLPYEDPSRLVTVFGARPDAAASQTRGSVSYLDFLDWRTRASGVFQSLGAYDVRAGFTVITSDGPERVSGLRVSSGFFEVLGVRPVLGRTFGAEDEGPSAPPRVILSHSAWQTRFHGRADVLGQAVTLQSPWLSHAEPHVVVGVLPPNFHFTMAERAQLWATIRREQGCWQSRRCRSLEAVGRLGDGVPLQTASANMTSVLGQLRREYPDDHGDPETAKLVPLTEVMLGKVRPILLMLLGSAGLLLLIACINVVSLLLARTDSRTREIAVRTSLGASSGRLALQFATEAVVLTVLSALAGLALAAIGIRFLTNLLSVDMIAQMPYLEGIGLNARLVAFAFVVSATAALVFALTPFLRLPRWNTFSGLKEGGRGFAGTNWRRFGAHLVVAELAIAALLLTGAGLLGKSLYQRLHVTTGINTDGLAAVSVVPVSVGAGAAETAPAVFWPSRSPSGSKCCPEWSLWDTQIFCPWHQVLRRHPHSGWDSHRPSSARMAGQYDASARGTSARCRRLSCVADTSPRPRSAQRPPWQSSTNPQHRAISEARIPSGARLCSVTRRHLHARSSVSSRISRTARRRHLRTRALTSPSINRALILSFGRGNPRRHSSRPLSRQFTTSVLTRWCVDSSR